MGSYITTLIIKVQLHRDKYRRQLETLRANASPGGGHTEQVPIPLAGVQPVPTGGQSGMDLAAPAAGGAAGDGMQILSGRLLRRFMKRITSSWWPDG